MNVLQNLIKLLLLLITTSSFACDVCSCAASNSSMMNITSDGHYLSFTYNYLRFRFKDGVHDNSPHGQDHIHQFGINGQYAINKKIALQMSIPYQNNVRNTEDERVSNIGIGDISLNGMFTVFTHQNHKIKTGLGVKFPTGKFDYEVAAITNTSASQLGTGSLDFNVPLEYVYSYKKFATQVRATYFYKTENKDNFKFGNQAQVKVVGAYKVIEGDNHYYGINLGISYDSYLETEIRESKILDTDGYLMNSTIGVNYESEKIITGINYQLPVSQNLIEGDVDFQQGINFYTYFKF